MMASEIRVIVVTGVQLDLSAFAANGLWAHYKIKIFDLNGRLLRTVAESINTDDDNDDLIMVSSNPIVDCVGGYLVLEVSIDDPKNTGAKDYSFMAELRQNGVVVAGSNQTVHGKLRKFDTRANIYWEIKK